MNHGMLIQRGRNANFLSQHLLALHIGSEVTGWFRKTREPQVLEVTPENVLAVLGGVGINCVLIGTHGLNVYRDQARATQDVDVLVTRKGVRKAVRSLAQAFPYLEVTENAAVARFLDPVTQKVVVDLLKPATTAMRSVFRHTVPVGKKYRIPNLEMALALKFLAMTAKERGHARRFLDAGDFTNIVEGNRGALDLAKLQRLADKMRPQGGKLIQKMIQAIDEGQALSILNFDK